MRVAVGSDERTAATDAVVLALHQRGVDVELYGPLNEECVEATTAQGARRYNDANVLAMSLRLTTPEQAKDILEAFLDTTDVDPTEVANIERVNRA